MRNYVRKFTTCLICGRKIKRGKYCQRDKNTGYKLRNRKYNRNYYLTKIKAKYSPTKGIKV